MGHKLDEMKCNLKILLTLWILYLDRRYRENAEKKVRMMKEEVKKNFIQKMHS